MPSNDWTPPRAAIRLSKILEKFSSEHGAIRFPVDVAIVAKETARIFSWDDPITSVEAANIRGFEGCLFSNDKKSNWQILFNNTLSSPGRIRFTQAHELGHYILHRFKKESFQCSAADMFNWSDDEKNLEAQADLFASYLLMPLDDYRKQINSSIDLDILSHCADRYGVSLTAAILKWLSYTEEKAVLIMSNDGFIDWAWSSEPAYRAGAFFKTRSSTIPIPDGSLASDSGVSQDRSGRNIPAKVWFKHAEKELELREMKIYADQYDSTITLLRLPQYADVWPPRIGG